MTPDPYLARLTGHYPSCFSVLSQLTQCQVGDHTGKDEGRKEGEGEDERVEEAVVPPPHTVAHPGTVMVKAFWKRERGNRLVRSGLPHRSSEASPLSWGSPALSLSLPR